MTTQDLEYHEAANIFRLDEEHIPQLAEDIKRHGLLSRIELLNGKIIDGRRRFLACKRASVEPEFYDATEIELARADPISYVRSLNEHRRHSSTSQLAMVASRANGLREKWRKDAEKRQAEGRKKGGETGGRGRPKTEKIALPSRGGKANESKRRDNSRETTSRIGREFGVSSKSVERGMNVVNKGAPEVQEAVDRNKMTVTKADQLVRTYPNKETQRHELKRILDEPRKKEASQKRSPQSVDNAKGKKIELSKDDKERVKALDTSTKIIDLLKSSQLIRMPKSNNYRKLAFQEVINWLKVEMRRL